jgi:hypothetical protein
VLTNMHNDLDYADVAAETPGMSSRPMTAWCWSSIRDAGAPRRRPAGLSGDRGGLCGGARTGCSERAVDGLMTFTQGFAIPCLLFRAVATLDLGRCSTRLLGRSTPARWLLRRSGSWVRGRLFGRRPGEAVAIGFGALFSNSVLLGLPITSAPMARTRWRRTSPSSRSMRRSAICSGSR